MMMKKGIAWLPALCIMVGIFYFSHQPAKVSGNLSGGISYRLICLAEPLSGQNWSDEKKWELAEKIDHPIRKLAHMTEYAVLGMAAAFGVITSVQQAAGSRKYFYFVTQIIGTVYAASDEFHQLFIPGRAGRFSDVVIDSFGVLIGWLLFCLLVWLIRKMCKK